MLRRGGRRCPETREGWNRRTSLPPTGPDYNGCVQLDLSAHQETLRDAIRDVLVKECTPAHLRSDVDHIVRGEPSALGDDLWRTAVGLDWPGSASPRTTAASGSAWSSPPSWPSSSAGGGARVLSPTMCSYAPVLRAATAHNELAAVAAGSGAAPSASPTTAVCCGPTPSPRPPQPTVTAGG